MQASDWLFFEPFYGFLLARKYIASIVLNPQDINKFRFELVDILSKNNFDIGKVRTGDGCYGGRRAKQMERRIMKVIKLYYFHKPFFRAFVEI